jgi:hypothetical protein
MHQCRPRQLVALNYLAGSQANLRRLNTSAMKHSGPIDEVCNLSDMKFSRARASTVRFRGWRGEFNVDMHC